MTDARFLRLALRLARRGQGSTSPNPMVGALLVKAGKVIGKGWHRRAGLPHAEIEALRDALEHHHNPRGATLFVTLEPCSTHGRTPPCTEAILDAGVKRVVFGAVDPNPRHAGKGLRWLRRQRIRVDPCPELAEDCQRLNEAFNHWIVQRTPFVTVKAAMTLDGKIATASGESKWITGTKAREHGMTLRGAADGIVVGVNTVIADDPSLTFRGERWEVGDEKSEVRGRRTDGGDQKKGLKRIILDSMARTPLDARVVADEFADLTTIVVSRHAPKNRVAALGRKVRVLVAPAETQNPKLKTQNLKIDLRWLLRQLGAEDVTHVLVEGGGEASASFLLGGFAQRVVFFYAPKVLGGRDSRKSVAGNGAARLAEALRLRDLNWEESGVDLILTARVADRS